MSDTSMHRNTRRVSGWIVLSLTLLAGVCSARSREQDPMVQQLTEMDGRLLRIERILSNQSLLEQAQRIEDLNNELRGLRGQVEQLQHSIDTARTQQREMYADLDKRLQAVESRATAAVSATPANPVAGSNDDDNVAYKKAFDLLKDGKYADAETAFSRFVASYPQSPLADNGHYWLGEARYVNKDFAQALREFRTVVDRYPDSRKLPDAWLKIGYCQYELKNWKDAREALRKVMQIAGDSASGKLAEQRLAKIQAEGH